MSMVPQIFDKQPPFVRFEEREMGLDAAATEKEGRPIPRIVVMACVTPHGSKDVVERVAEDWLKQIRRQAMSGQYNLEWVRFFEEQYKEWIKGNELPREGTPIATWPMTTNESRRRIRAAGYSTVEDLAQVPDSGLMSIGMDGRYWRDTARGWLNEAKDKGLNAKALADANAQIEELKGQNARLVERVEKMERRLEERVAVDEEPAAEKLRGTARRKAEAA